MSEIHPSMNTLVLETKLHPPQIYSSTLLRPRLFHLMEDYQSYRLIVVSAPAGYGKSTLLTMWGKRAATVMAWVSLDDMDNDVLRFWSTLVESLMKVTANPLRRSVSVIHLGGQLALDALVNALISDLKEYEQDIVMVLDDYHLIKDASIHRSVEYLIKHLPGHVHLVIVSRNSMPFSISRLRVQGKVLEIGVPELTFTADEVEHFYRDILHMDIPEETLNRVMQLTEGWVSGLQLAAMAMQGSKNPSDIFARFGGAHQLVAEFLNDEVLHAESEVVQTFLLETSILNRMTESLCIAVTGIQESGAILRHLHATNSFLIPLDEERVWFRYHHLFSDFLRHRLVQAGTHQVHQLHRRAAGWFQAQGFMSEAVDHAIQGEDFSFAVDILESNCAKLLHAGELHILLHWFEQIPHPTLKAHPLAKILHGWVLTLLQDFNPALQVVAEVRESLSSQPQTAFVEELALELDVLRGYIALMQGHATIAIESFQASVAKTTRYSKFFLQGVNLNTGEPFVLPSRLGMRGHLKSAFQLYTELRQIWKHSGLAILGYGSVALGELYYEWNQLDELDYFIPRGMELGKTVQDPGILVPLHLLHAKYLRVRGMTEEMWQSVNELQTWLDTSALNGHWDDIVAAFKVRLSIEQNRADEVLLWIDVNREKQHQPVAAVGEYCLITLARALIYTRQWKSASRLLSKLLHSAETQERLTSKIEVSLLQTIASGAQNDETTAMDTLRRAIRWGMTENYHRTFLDEGEALVHWLRKLVTDRCNITREEYGYARGLVATFEKSKLPHDNWMDKTRQAFSDPQSSYVEPLTNREKDILSAISVGLTNADIAKQLGLSVGTVKLYAHNVFGKLGVKNRTQAVVKARALNLL